MSGSKILGKVLLVGAGRMGGAMLKSWLDGGLEAAQLVVLDPKASEDIAASTRRLGVALNPNLATLEIPAVVVIAVKPQSMAEALLTIVNLVGANTLVLSVVAGKTIMDIGRLLPDGIAIVRAMPNLPAAVGRGVTVAVANPVVAAAQKASAHNLLQAVGLVEWIDDEELMDAVTAVSGSGPAYVFYLTEALVEAGVAAGLPRNLAMTLARATVIGSGELLFRSEETARALRQAVTSPGGTTQAALEVLMGMNGLAPLMGEAVAAAKRRAMELAG